MHEVFAGVRIWQLEHIQKLKKHAEFAAHRIYGEKRWKGIRKMVHARIPRENLMELAFAILHTSDWYDDERDTVRTLANMETSAIVYCDEQLHKMDLWPIYVEDKRNPKCAVGIEQTFDVVLEFADGVFIRYVGTIDGLVHDVGRAGDLVLDENKTASRLSDAWRDSFHTANQVTGYCASSTSVFGFPVMRSRVTGLRFKPSSGEDVMPIIVSRDTAAIFHWASWLRRTAETYMKWENDYENADRYTHSCTRYFRPCALIPFCADTPEGRRDQWDSMIPADPSPSERSILTV